MRVLLDECLPRRLKGALIGHEARTVPEMGWASKRNGELLRLAERDFDVFLTVDQKLQNQQNLPTLSDARLYQLDKINAVKTLAAVRELRYLPTLVFVSLLWLPMLATVSAGPSYRAILESYRAGDTDGAIAAVSQLSGAAVDEQVRSLIAAENRASKGGPVEAVRRRIWLQTAAVVHMECALALERRIDQHSFELRGMQMDGAATLVRALYEPPRGRRPEGPGTDHEFLRAWFLFSAAHQQARGQWRHASFTLGAGREQLGDDPELLLATGAMHEITWSLEHDAGRTVDFSGNLPEAEAVLRRAVEVNPKLDEARLRLGRVQARRGNADGALQTLGELRPGTTEPGFLYLARLFEGDVDERRGDSQKAEQSYTLAMATMPSGESAAIALAHLLHSLGRRGEAVRQVTALATGAKPEAANDPWLFYKMGVAWRADGYLAALRALVRQ